MSEISFIFNVISFQGKARGYVVSIVPGEGEKLPDGDRSITSCSIDGKTRIERAEAALSIIEEMHAYLVWQQEKKYIESENL